MKKSKTLKNKKYDYVIAIPSYKRAETLRDKTLSLLKEYKIDPKRIDVFVANSEEKEIYEKLLEPNTYHKIIVGVPKIGPQRNFISDYYTIGKPVIEMDDDIKGFIEYCARCKNNEKPLSKPNGLETMIQKGFNECKKHNLRLWGIYPTPNGYFMDDKIDTDLRFIIGCFNGMFNPGTKDVKLKLEMDKEDYERSIRFYIKDNGVLRMRNYAPKTSYYTEKGGNQEFRTKKTVMDGAKWIVKEFPDYATLNLTKKSGYAEVRLRDTRK